MLQGFAAWPRRRLFRLIAELLEVTGIAPTELAKDFAEVEDTFESDLQAHFTDIKSRVLKQFLSFFNARDIEITQGRHACGLLELADQVRARDADFVSELGNIEGMPEVLVDIFHGLGDKIGIDGLGEEDAEALLEGVCSLFGFRRAALRRGEGPKIWLAVFSQFKKLPLI